MTHLRQFLFVVSTLTLSTGCESSPTQFEPPVDSNERIADERSAYASICVSEPVPVGRVVIGASNSPACPDNNGNPNALTVRTITSPVLICIRWPVPAGSVIQPVPVGYLVIGASSSPACPYNDGTPNALTIRRPMSPVSICIGWPVAGKSVIQSVPERWIVMGALSSPACPYNDGTPNVLTIRPLTIRPDTPLSSVCILSPIFGGSVIQSVPRDYVVVGTSNSPTCPIFNTAFNALTIRRPVSPMSICLRWPIPGVPGFVLQGPPTGYVVVGATNSPACPYGGTNALTIRTPESPMSICLQWPTPGVVPGYENQAVPPGYVVVGATNSPACPFDGINALSIRRLESPMSICLRWPTPGVVPGYAYTSVPRGYIVVGAFQSFQCPYDGLNALTIRTLESPMSICIRWPTPGVVPGYAITSVPHGYIVVGASRSSECPYYNNTPNVLTIRTLESPMSICTRWPAPGGYVNQSIPSGYVVVGTSSSSVCAYPNTLNVYTIRKV